MVTTFPAGSNTMPLAKVDQFGKLHFSTKSKLDTPPLADVTIDPSTPPSKWQLKMTQPGGGNLREDPVTKIMEVEDVILVLGYE